MGQKHKRFRESRTPFLRISPARHPQKSSQHVRACAVGDGAICSKNRKIVPYHGANPNTRNGARLRSPSPIMAPGTIKYGVTGVRLTRNHSQIGEQVLLLVLLINLINKGAFFL